MDSLKFAFDTLIIGALAMPWLWLFIRIVCERGSTEPENIQFPIISALSKPTQQAVAGVLTIALGYFLGSAISRISSDFFDDEEILHGIPTQSSIQQGVYLHEYCDGHSVLAAIHLPAELARLPGGTAAFCQEDKPGLAALVAEFFRLQEGKLLLEGEDRLGRVREFHDQVEILRGATLNGAILFILSCFGLCALYRTRLYKREAENKTGGGKLGVLLKYASYSPAVFFLVAGVWEMHQHFAHQSEPASAASIAKVQPAISKHAPISNPYESHRDPPLAEALLILLGVGGLCLRLSDDSPRLFHNVCLIAAVLTLVAYGAWWWTEVLYDQQVIHSLPTNVQSNPA